MRILSSAVLSVLLFSANIAPSFAAVSTIQALDFGEFLIMNDDSQHVLTVNTVGGYTNDSALVVIQPPQEGIYDIDDLDSLRAVSSVDVVQLAPLTGGTGAFEMFDFQVSHNSVTDIDGSLEVTVGASVRSSGTGASYSDSTRTGSFQITINY